MTTAEAFARLPLRSSREGHGECATLLRGDLIVLCRDLGFHTGVEVGVAWGVFSEFICQTIPAGRLFGVDPYFTHENMYAAAADRMKVYPHYALLRLTSVDAALRFGDKSLDFVYIDGDHSQCYADLCAWVPKVRTGGVVAGHDYSEYADPDSRRKWSVIDAVHRFVSERAITPWYTTRRARERRSFFWEQRR